MPSPTRERVLIAGSGPGGLTAALALQQAGFEVELFERASSPVGGSAFTLWPNALQALDRLGLGEDLRAITKPFEGIAMFERGGKMLFSVSGDWMKERFGHSGLAIERAQFLRIVINKLGAQRIHFGKTCIGFKQDASTVTALLTDGETAQGAALIGADGLHSAVRIALFGSFEPRFAGYRVLRGVCEFPLPNTLALTSLGCGLQFGLFPMAQQRVYWFASSGAHGTASRNGQPGEMLSQFEPWHAPVRELIDRTPCSGILQNDIFDTDPLPSWSKGRVTLLGDAAHPATPDLGQGLCQAIEDAVVLAERLTRIRDIPAALIAYEEHRKPRTRSITLQSRKIGKAGTWTNPFACYLRNQAIRATPERLHRKQLEDMFRFQT